MKREKLRENKDFGLDWLGVFLFVFLSKFLLVLFETNTGFTLNVAPLQCAILSCSFATQFVQPQLRSGGTHRGVNVYRKEIAR